uniref:Myosin motor domain-containing protein n=1 Tax=Steinernema glaseri TaxID=37863 RepID=A0A1I7Y0E9_9BILA
MSGIAVKSYEQLESLIQTRPSGRLIVQARRRVAVKPDQQEKSDRVDVNAEIKQLYGRGESAVLHCVSSEM